MIVFKNTGPVDYTLVISFDPTAKGYRLMPDQEPFREPFKAGDEICMGAPDGTIEPGQIFVFQPIGMPMIEIKEQGSNDIGNDWHRPFVVYRVMEFRRGWLGVWDALKEAIWHRKFPRPQVPQTYTISLYHKPEDESTSYMYKAQVEPSKYNVQIEGGEPPTPYVAE